MRANKDHSMLITIDKGATMRTKIHFDKDSVIITFTSSNKSVVDVNRTAATEMALLKTWGSHKCSTWERDENGNFIYTITRKNATIATLDRGKGVLRGFAFEV